MQAWPDFKHFSQPFFFFFLNLCLVSFSIIINLFFFCISFSIYSMFFAFSPFFCFFFHFFVFFLFHFLWYFLISFYVHDVHIFFPFVDTKLLYLSKLCRIPSTQTWRSRRLKSDPATILRYTVNEWLKTDRKKWRIKLN